MMYQRCRCCGTVLCWIGFRHLACPKIGCAEPTKLEVGQGSVAV